MQTALLLNILFHVVITFVVLSLLFWYYFSVLASAELNRQLKHIVNQFFRMARRDQQQNALLSEYATHHREQLEVFQLWFQGEDMARKKNNQLLRTMNVMLILTLAFSIVFSIVSMNLSCPVNNTEILGHVLKEIVCVFLLVAMMEIFFFKYVATQYAPILPSEIKDALVRVLQERLSQ